MNARKNKTSNKFSKSKLLLFVFAVLLILAMLSACSGAEQASPDLTPPASAAPSDTPAATATPSPTPVKTTQPEASHTPNAEASATPKPAETPKAIETSKPTETPKPTKKPSSNTSGQPLSGVKLGLDPGHQSHANSDTEPVSPGSSDMKKKVSSGTQGRYTRVPEYKINLQVALKLKDKLEALGATVVMTRETNDVDISNAERAQMMNDANVDCWLRIHANGNDDESVYGMFMLVPKQGCLDTSDSAVQEVSVNLGKALLKDAVASSGAKDLGLQPRGDQSGFNWSKVPVCNIEMGYMTNENEDNALVSDDYQEKIAEGLAQGFVDYFTK